MLLLWLLQVNLRGAVDAAAVCSAPADKACNKLATTNSLGRLCTNSMQAFSDDEMHEMAQQLAATATQAMGLGDLPPAVEQVLQTTSQLCVQKLVQASIVLQYACE
jgi:hypothetical protein